MSVDMLVMPRRLQIRPRGLLVEVSLLPVPDL